MGHLPERAAGTSGVSRDKTGAGLGVDRPGGRLPRQGRRAGLDGGRGLRRHRPQRVLRQAPPGLPAAAGRRPRRRRRRGGVAHRSPPPPAVGAGGVHRGVRAAWGADHDRQGGAGRPGHPVGADGRPPARRGRPLRGRAHDRTPTARPAAGRHRWPLGGEQAPLRVPAEWRHRGRPGGGGGVAVGGHPGAGRGRVAGHRPGPERPRRADQRGRHLGRPDPRPDADAPRNAGLSVYRGEVVGSARWPAILAEDTWRGVVAVLDDPGRRTTPGRPPRWLLSGLAVCGVCGARVVSKPRVALAW